MTGNNLITLLKSYSKKEISQFDKFLRSPYFTEGKNIRSKVLHDYFCLLKNYYPDFKSENLRKETLFEKLYSGKKYNDVLMRRLNSDLTRLVEKFLLQEELKESKTDEDIFLLKALSKKGLDKFFLKQYSLFEKDLEGQKYNSNRYYYKQQLCLIKNNYAYLKDDMLKLYNLQDETDSFFYYYLCRSLEICRNIENDKAILNLNCSADFEKDVLDYFKKNERILNDNPFIAMHYYELMLNVNQKDECYFKLKAIKNELLNKLGEDTLRNIFITLVNYCIRKTNMGFDGFRAERMELDKEIMETDIHNKMEYFDMNYFLSSVRNAVSLKNFNWSEKFIERYENRLEPKHKQFAVNYALGVLNYGKKNYGTALEHLAKINIEYSARKQQIKNLMLLIFYETGAFENALNIIDSSRHFLSKDKQIPENRKKAFSEFLKHSHELVLLRTNPDKNKISQLRINIEKKSNFVYKDWLLEKIKELNRK